jgi:branched-chain amino acid transport system ATP-binding protein
LAPHALAAHASPSSSAACARVDGVSLAVQPGERRALIGPNGAGKTTLFNLIAGAFPVTQGTIRLFGEDVTGMAAHRRAWAGLSRTFQVSNLFPTLTVLENCLLAVQALTPARLAMHRPLGGYPDLHAARARHARGRRTHRPRRHRRRQLSHGEQRQLEIGLALAGRRACCCSTSRRPGSRRPRPAHGGAARTLDPAITVLIIEHDMDIALESPARHRAPLRPGHRRRHARGDRARPAGAGDLPRCLTRSSPSRSHTYYGDSHVLHGVSLAVARRREC